VNPLEYCSQKAAPPGSSLYYALRQTPSSQRDALSALLAFRQELVSTVLTVSDPSVAQAKLAWWQRETQQAQTVPPVHPVLIALARSLPNDFVLSPFASTASGSRQSAVTIEEKRVPPDVTTALLALIGSYEADLMQSRYLDLPGLTQYLKCTDGAFTTLLCSVALTLAHAAPEPQPIPTGAWSEALGIALGLARIVADLGENARQGRIYLPISEMQRFGVTAADILNRRYSDAFSALMRFQTERARAELQAALAAMPRAGQGVRPALKLPRAQVAIALRLLAEIESSGFQVLHQRIALTPVRNAWSAWWGAR
jgi:phytoene synthase